MLKLKIKNTHTFHCIRLPSACRSVRKDRCIVARKSRCNDRSRRSFVHLRLRALHIVHAIKCESVRVLPLIVAAAVRIYRVLCHSDCSTVRVNEKILLKRLLALQLTIQWRTNPHHHREVLLRCCSDPSTHTYGRERPRPRRALTLKIKILN